MSLGDIFSIDLIFLARAQGSHWTASFPEMKLVCPDCHNIHNMTSSFKFLSFQTGIFL